MSNIAYMSDLQGDFLDTYHNLSYKEIMGNLWISEFCEQAEFVVKTDDDQFIDLYEVTTNSYNNKLTTPRNVTPNLYNVTPFFNTIFVKGDTDPIFLCKYLRDI